MKLVLKFLAYECCNLTNFRGNERNFTIAAGNFCLASGSFKTSPSVAAFRTKAASAELRGGFFKRPINVGLCFFRTASKSVRMPAWPFSTAASTMAAKSFKGIQGSSTLDAIAVNLFSDEFRIFLFFSTFRRDFCCFSISDFRWIENAPSFFQFFLLILQIFFYLEN